jgi:hypothetical protein
METQLEKDLKIFLSLSTDSDFVNVDSILGSDKKEAIKKLYNEYYVRPDIKWQLNESTLKQIPGYNQEKIDWNIRNIKPFYEDFTVEKFWFKTTNKENTPYKDLQIEAGTVLGFRDGINTIFYQGEYLEGGDICSQQTKSIKTQTTNDTIANTPNIKEEKKEASSANYQRFIYAYFPPKLYLSPNNKAYFILTQGKHLLRNREQPVVRFYFNLKPKTKSIDKSSVANYQESIEHFKKRVNSFVNIIEKHLNDRRIPFQFKLPISLENFYRADTLVLYIAQKHYYYLYEFIKKHSTEYSDILGLDSPLFTEPFGSIKGVSIAEDPDSGDSFGMNRCTLLYRIIGELAENPTSKNAITIKSIIDKLESIGYDKDAFYKNPYTGFDYSLVYIPINIKTTFGGRYPQNTRYYLYVYGKVALNYALDLLEKAIWLDANNITWLTYYEEKGYRLVTSDESDEIFWFLYQILKFEWMRVFFPDNVIHLIVNKVKESERNPSYLNKISTNWKTVMSGYSDLTDEINSILKSSEKSWPDKIKDGFKKIKDIISKDVSNVSEYWETVFLTREWEDTTPIYEINKGDFKSNKEIIQNAREVYYRYIKPLYPIKNGYGNYDYCPTSKGKLQIAMIMLYVYCPSLFGGNQAQQESL